MSNFENFRIAVNLPIIIFLFILVYTFKFSVMLTAIAGGKIAADGSILKATPGITISTELIHTNVDIGYTVNLPERLVSDANYIVQLTAENFGENGPDYEVTTIAARFPSVNGFEVIIWANSDRDGALPRTRIVPVKSNWHFVVYDIN